MKRSATAIWEGPLRAGGGMLSTPSRALEATPFSSSSRFESGTGTNSEELLAAAHAGCFAMALAGSLDEAGFVPDRIEVTAEITLDRSVAEGGWSIAGSRLWLNARVPGLDHGKFGALAIKAKATCPVSRLLNAPISLDAKLL